MNLEDYYAVYSCAGKDAYQKQKFLSQILEQLKALGADEFDYLRFSALETPVPELLSECLAWPFMAPRKLVVYEDVEKLSDTKELMAYVKEPNASTILVLMIADKRKLNKILKEHSRVVSLDPPDRKALQEWLKAQLKHEDMQLDMRSQNLLLESFAGSMYALENRLEQMITYAGSQKKLSYKEAQMFLKIPDEVKIFDFLDSLAAGKRLEALHKLQAMIGSGTAPQEMLGVIFWNFKRLWAAHSLQNQGLAWHDICEKLSIKSWAASKFAVQMKRFSLPKLKQVIGHLLTLEKDLRKGAQPGSLLMEKLVFDV